MILVIEIAAVIILVFCLSYVIKYGILLTVKHDADKAFGELFAVLPKLYEAVITLFSTQDALSEEDRTLAENTKTLIFKALNFSVAKDGNERIIAYANSILDNTEKFIEIAAEKSYTGINAGQYNSLLEGFNKTKKHYNDCAKKLRHYIDVFPTSFFARVKKIKTMDYMN